MERLKREKTVADGHSPVNRYELLCVERMAQGQIGPDEEKILVAFEAFDVLLPGLGVYSRIFRKLREDLFDAVYSDDLTTQNGAISRIPYFTHIKRRQNVQSEKLDEVEDQLDTVKKRLFEKHKQFEESQKRTEQLENALGEQNELMEDLRSTLADKTKEITRLENELAKEKEDRQKEKNLLEGDIQDLQAAEADHKEEIEFLSKYKKGYDDLYYAFLDQPETDETPRKKKKPLVSTKRANIMTNIELAQKLEEQIMNVLNTAVEEFDKFMENHKDELQSLEIKDDITDAEFEAQEIDIDNADQQLEAVQERFKNTIGDISNELLLLKQHSTMLMEQLQILEETHPTIMRKGNKLKVVDPGVTKSGDIMLTKTQEKHVKRIQEESLKIQDRYVQSPYLKLQDQHWEEMLDSILSAGLDEDDEEDDSDPFIPQERVFSKYAAMLYTSSNNGRSFDEFKDAKFCPSCGEKTVICPHKLPGEEKVFALPLNCTHLKVTRPKVKINKELVSELMSNQEEEDVSFDLPVRGGNKFDGNSMGGQSGTLHSPTTSRDSPSTVSVNPGHADHGIFCELMRNQEEEDVSFDLPVRGGNKFDGNSMGGQSGTLHSPTTSRDSPGTGSVFPGQADPGIFRELMRNQEEEDVSFDLPVRGGNKFDGNSMGGQSGTLHSPTTSRDSPSTVSESHLRYPVHSVFDDFKQRTNLERSIPRPLSRERCLSMTEQFWTYVIWDDDNGKDDDLHNSITDKLYLYMEDRYLVKDIMYLCTFDFLYAVVEFSEQDKLVQVFGNILVGNLEGAVFRYLILLCDFIDAVEWREVEDFRAFAAVVYPFLGEDDLETLQMSYTSFSENKISKRMVSMFIQHLILKSREPRFQDMENRLIPFQTQESKLPAMSEKEFKEAIDNILPLSNDRLRKRLFYESEKMIRKEGISDIVPISRLAQVASYLGLLNITNIVSDTINDRITEWRGRPSSSGSARQVVDHDGQILHDEEGLITMSDVKLLSRNISR